MKLGDYVGLVNNRWIEENPKLSGSSIAKELWSEQPPDPLGVIVELGNIIAGVLTSSGIVEYHDMKKLVKVA